MKLCTFCGTPHNPVPECTGGFEYPGVDFDDEPEGKTLEQWNAENPEEVNAIRERLNRDFNEFFGLTECHGDPLGNPFDRRAA